MPTTHTPNGTKTGKTKLPLQTMYEIAWGVSKEYAPDPYIFDRPEYKPRKLSQTKPSKTDQVDLSKLSKEEFQVWLKQWQAELKHKKPVREIGLGVGHMWVSPDAFSPEVDAEIAAEFEASEIFPDSLID